MFVSLLLILYICQIGTQRYELFYIHILYMYFIYIYIANISNVFYFFVAYFFSIIIKLFGKQKFLILLSCNLSIFFYGYCLLCTILESLLQVIKKLLQIVFWKLYCLTLHIQGCDASGLSFPPLSLYCITNSPIWGRNPKTDGRQTLRARKTFFYQPTYSYNMSNPGSISQKTLPQLSWAEVSATKAREKQREFTGSLREPRVPQG